MSAGTSPSFVVSTVIIILAVAVSFTQGGCEFKKSWSGRWFLSGVPNLILISSNHIETKGECFDSDGDKYLLFDKVDKCYRCLAIHEKHETVLQYKETYCDPHQNILSENCNAISGDAPLISLFRKHPEPKPTPCPFRSAPFVFSYNRGPGDCSNPPSKAESCTDDSRLVLKYQACPDVPSTESNVEELVCLATWKEGSTRYLVGRISQGNRRSLISDEDQYRCFIYQKSSENNKSVYNIAQSGDATCNGLQSAFEGSRTMKLTTVDNHHNRCKFPLWITDHHTWLSLDHHKTYKFSQRNATLKILDDEPPKPNKVQENFAFGFQEFGFESQEQKKQNSEMRVVCHMILQSHDHKKVQIVAHVTAGCDSGYVCMMFYKRDSNVIELQQTESYVENPDEACANFNPTTTPYTTLITTTLHTKKCPHLGRYTLFNVVSPNGERRKKRQQPDDVTSNQLSADCYPHNYDALAVGCGGSHGMEFRSPCAQQSVSGKSCGSDRRKAQTIYPNISRVLLPRQLGGERRLVRHSVAGVAKVDGRAAILFRLYAVEPAADDRHRGLHGQEDRAAGAAAVRRQGELSSARRAGTHRELGVQFHQQRYLRPRQRKFEFRSHSDVSHRPVLAARGARHKMMKTDRSTHSVRVLSVLVNELSKIIRFVFV